MKKQSEPNKISKGAILTSAEHYIESYYIVLGTNKVVVVHRSHPGRQPKRIENLYVYNILMGYINRGEIVFL